MHDLIIIGAGPAGLTAGLYAGRYRLNTLILEKASVGGQIVISATIENFPGFPGGISTLELVERFKKQVEELDITIDTQEVMGITRNKKSKNPAYNIETAGKSYETKSIIIATGAQPKRLGIKGEDRLIGKGVSYCGTCDGPLFRDKDVAVIGGGDRALEEAIFLTGYARKVSIIHRRHELRASKILVEKAKNNPKINFIFDNVIEEISGENRVEGASLRNLKTDALANLDCDGLFIFVGILPHTSFLTNQLELDDAGFIITDEELKTSLGGVFACGDCRKKSLYQVITACAEGAMAADSAYKYLVRT